MHFNNNHLFYSNNTIRQALLKLDFLGIDAILFVINENKKLVGSITDGDIRRGLINGFNVENFVDTIMNKSPKFLQKDNYDISEVIYLRESDIRILPVIDKKGVLVNIINFRENRSYLPIDVVIMAGGRGERLKPLTNTIPKPLLKVGDKPIMEHNIDQLSRFGIENFWVTVKYLGNQIEEYFGDGYDKKINIEYVREKEPLGTIGSVSLIDNFTNDYILVSNSDLLTNIDYEQFFLDFKRKEADLAVLSIPYQVALPYAILETENGEIKSFKEKPTYTYYSNGGVYLMKREVLENIPKNNFFNATDLMEILINNNKKIVSFNFSGYWLDVGKHEDFEKAQIDIKNINFY